MATNPQHLQELARNLGLEEKYVRNVLNLFHEECTVPFIARYRRDLTGGMEAQDLCRVQEEMARITALHARRDAITKLLGERGALTDKLRHRLSIANTVAQLEEIYLPYKPKRAGTLAAGAREKGYGPVADFILQGGASMTSVRGKISQTLKDGVDKVLNGVGAILSEEFAQIESIRNSIRKKYKDYAVVSVKPKRTTTKSKQPEKAAKGKPPPRKPTEKPLAESVTFLMEREQRFSSLAHHQILALSREENNGTVAVKVYLSERDEADVFRNAVDQVKTSLSPQCGALFNFLREWIKDSLTRHLMPSISRELRKAKSDEAEEQAIQVFAQNLRALLMTPPVPQSILGIDPGFRQGCKFAAISSSGSVLTTGTIYPHTSSSQKAREELKTVIKTHNVKVIAIGNGTASRETEALVADLVAEEKLNCTFCRVSECGASVYSTSVLAKSEFPTMDPLQISSVSIARRLLDPLSELVKIDPKALGVGMYQHDVNAKKLSEKLEQVVFLCVNDVGVDLNRASEVLLQNISGLNKARAKSIVEHRRSKPFRTREQLRSVKGIGPKSYEQAAGFLRLPSGENPLDRTLVHPEAYDVAMCLIKKVGASLDDLRQSKLWRKNVTSKLENMSSETIEKISQRTGKSSKFCNEVRVALSKPAVDPRESLPPVILRSTAMTLEELPIGEELDGTVTNVLDFGTFVDVGVKENALLHKSKYAGQHITVGDRLKVVVETKDVQRRRIGLRLRRPESGKPDANRNDCKRKRKEAKEHTKRVKI